LDKERDAVFFDEGAIVGDVDVAFAVVVAPCCTEEVATTSTEVVVSGSTLGTICETTRGDSATCSRVSFLIKKKKTIPATRIPAKKEKMTTRKIEDMLTILA